jgi:hypothetical protein
VQVAFTLLGPPPPGRQAGPSMKPVRPNPA